MRRSANRAGAGVAAGHQGVDDVEDLGDERVEIAMAAGDGSRRARSIRAAIAGGVTARRSSCHGSHFGSSTGRQTRLAAASRATASRSTCETRAAKLSTSPRPIVSS